LFTGIIEGVGEVRSVERRSDHAIVEIKCDFDLETTNVGESIAVNGCCLTVTSRLGKCFWADISLETFDRTTLKNCKQGTPVNLERALKVGGRLGGHMVQGHVDCVGNVIDIIGKTGPREFTVRIPHNLSRYIVEKGSVSIDGVSLTVNRCTEDHFTVMVIPHTQLKSTFQSMKVGDEVNLEVDIIGKYVEKLRFLDSEEYSKESRVTEEFLRKHGF
jgi:riboflavin synthase